MSVLLSATRFATLQGIFPTLRSVTPSLQLVSQRLMALANQIALFVHVRFYFKTMAAELTTASKMTERLPSVTRFKQSVSQRATCVATKLRDKLQEKLPSVTAPLDSCVACSFRHMD